MRRAFIPIALLAVIATTLFTGGPAGAATAPITLHLGSVDSSGTTAADADVIDPAISPDGRWLAFVSDASNLVPGFVDHNGPGTDVYLRDTVTGDTFLVSYAIGTTTEGGNATSFDVQVSDSAQYVTYRSRATDLVAGFSGGGGNEQVFVYDRSIDTTALVSHVDGSSTTAPSQAATAYQLASDRTAIAFETTATNVVAGFVDGNGGGSDVYRYQLPIGTQTLVSRSASSATTSANADSGAASISDDGNTIGFMSTATDLVNGFVGSGITCTYVFSVAAGGVTIATPKFGTSATAPSAASSGFVTGDGRHVVFDSSGTDLIAAQADGFGKVDVFVRDLTTGVTSLVTGAGGSPTNGVNGDSTAVSASDDGQFVAVSSKANNLVAGFVDNNGPGEPDAYLVDVAGRRPALASSERRVRVQGANGIVSNPQISGDGRVMYFTSNSTNLGAVNMSNAFQLYSYRGDCFTASLVSHTVDTSSRGTDADVALGSAPHAVGTGGQAAFTSSGSNLVTGVSGLGSVSQAYTTSTVERTGLGYWLVARDGGVFSFGDAQFYGSTGALTLNKPIVSGASTPTGRGYWFVASDGGVFTFGDAAFSGSTGAMTLEAPIVSMMRAGCQIDSYWLVGADGRVYSFGPDAFASGDLDGFALNKPIVGAASTPTGKGYWLVASDGGIFAFGDAQFYGSTGALTLNQPIVAIAPTATGRGYWLVARDGGVFSFGDAEFYGSTGALTLNQPVVGASATPSGLGYWFVAADGGIFSFGDAEFYGSTGGYALNQPIVAMAVD